MSKKNGRAPYTKHMKKIIREHMKRTGWGSASLVSIIQQDNPLITAKQVNEIIAQSTDTVILDYYKAILKAYKAIPKSLYKTNRRSDDRIKITGRMRNELIRELERTNVSPTLLMKTKPKHMIGLTANIMMNWKIGKSTTAPKEEWDFVLDTLRSRPSRSVKINTTRELKGYIPVTERHQATIIFHRARTGVPFTGLLSSRNPYGIAPSTISSWVAGTVSSAKKEAIEWVLNEFESLPDKAGW